MKTILGLLLILSTINIAAQHKNSITMEYPRLAKNQMELADLRSWLEIGYQPVYFNGPGIQGKDYYIVMKEIWYGTVKKTDTIVNTPSSQFFEPVKDTLKLTVMSGKSSQKSLRVQFNFERFSINTECLATLSDDYSMRVFGTHVTIEPNKPFYAFAYILPYEKDNNKYYCAVEGSGKDIESWGKEFGIEHYVLFEMCFFDRKTTKK